MGADLAQIANQQQGQCHQEAKQQSVDQAASQVG
jgi:hypothetical protein